MTLAKLKELEGRIAAASGPDIGLDCQLEAAVAIIGQDWPNLAEGYSWGFADDGRRVEAFTIAPDGEQVVKRRYKPLPYTASLDAASGLAARVLPGWNWGIASGMTGRAGAYGMVVSGLSNGSEWVSAATPALALVLATVRALIVREEGNG